LNHGLFGNIVCAAVDLRSIQTDRDTRSARRAAQVRSGSARRGSPRICPTLILSEVTFVNHVVRNVNGVVNLALPTKGADGRNIGSDFAALRPQLAARS